MIVTMSVAAALLVSSWLLYPAALRLVRPRKRPAAASVPTGTLGAVIVTRDSPQVVSRRVDNLLESEGSAFTEVLVVLDWTIRARIHEFESVLGARARVLTGDAPGKAAGLNAGMKQTVCDWVLLADSWQCFRPDAVRRLREAVADDTFSAVSGRVVNDHTDPIMRLYWRYENGIRSAQARRHSLVTTSGAICLIRRDAWHPIPVGAICDDLFITLGLAMRGHRVGYCPDAIASDPRVNSRSEELQKKVRTLTGLNQLLAWHPAVILPWRNPIWVDFLFHKVARLLTPYLVLVLLIGALVLAARDPVVLGGGAALFGTIILLAFAVAPRPTKAVGSKALWVGMLLCAPLIATYNGLRQNWRVWRHDTSSLRTATSTHAGESG